MKKTLAILGLVPIIIGVLLLVTAWFSLNIYDYSANSILYSLWLDCGLIVIGIVILLIAMFTREK
jgi:ABC-type protease/lipase transport system fused ATPase/permease subunit